MASDLEALLVNIAGHAAAYRDGAGARSAAPERTYAQMLERFDQPMPDEGLPTPAVIDELRARVEGGLANMTGPRFFGWVIGASAPAGLAADWLTSAWAQNTGNAHATPAAAACEEIAGRWIVDLLGLPAESSVGFVTGGTMANFTGLAAGRNEVLRRAGWDVESDGLIGAPPIHVVVGEEAHSTVFSALRYLGLGANRAIRVPVDDQGRIRADAFADVVSKLDGPILAAAQAGHINSGAFDPVGEIADLVHAKGGWLHVDGAIGLWALAVPELAHLTQGLDKADSWGGDGHKWLQTPQDTGYAIVRDKHAHRRAMGISASYLPGGDERHPADHVPELSRRARGFSTWAMLRSLGRQGVADMVRRHVAQAQRMARRLEQAHGVAILNDVVLNQVAVRLGTDLAPDVADRLTAQTLAQIQRDGVCFVGGAAWRGVQIVRVSVIGASTTDADIDASADAILDAWRRVRSDRGGV